MRIKALILFFPFAIFLIETASVLPAMQGACTIVSTEESSCCILSQEDKQDQCSNNDEEDSENSSDDDCSDKTDCTTCPVCYTFILQQQYEWRAQLFFFKKTYRLLNTTYNSIYTGNVWKPPNYFPA